MLTAVQTGANVCVTGNPGTGKSLLAEVVYSELQLEEEAAPRVAAMTGISGTNINAPTLHSLLGVGLAQDSAREIADHISSQPSLVQVWRKMTTLVLEEVGMLSRVLFEKLEEVARHLRGQGFFGGIQLVMFGDFLQLPPVEGGYVFTSPLWESCFPVGCRFHLTQVQRQADPRFLSLLDDVRYGG